MSDIIPMKILIEKLKSYEHLFGLSYCQIKVDQHFFTDCQVEYVRLRGFPVRDIKTDNFIISLGRRFVPLLHVCW
jgi:hypothetical protein